MAEGRHCVVCKYIDESATNESTRYLTYQAWQCLRLFYAQICNVLTKPGIPLPVPF